MANNIGVTGITAPIDTLSDQDNFPITYANKIQGGYKTVSTIADRDLIPVERLTVNTLINVIETNTIYRWDGSSFVTDFKNYIGLNNVENTLDLNKPVSTATQTALNLKLDISNAVTSPTPLGIYNVATNTPTLTDIPNVSASNGQYYDVVVSGSISFSGSNFASGSIFNVGDKLVKYGTQWGRTPFAIGSETITEPNISKDAQIIKNWEARAYLNNAQVVYQGSIYYANANTLSTDIPAISTKWSLTLTNYDNRININESNFDSLQRKTIGEYIEKPIIGATTRYDYLDTVLSAGNIVSSVGLDRSISWTGQTDTTGSEVSDVSYKNVGIGATGRTNNTIVFSATIGTIRTTNPFIGIGWDNSTDKVSILLRSTGQITAYIKGLGFAEFQPATTAQAFTTGDIVTLECKITSTGVTFRYAKNGAFSPYYSFAKVVQGNFYVVNRGSLDFTLGKFLYKTYSQIQTNTDDIITLKALNTLITPVITKGKYQAINTGNLVNDTNSYYSDSLPVGDGIDYYYTGSVQFLVAAFAFFDANNVLISTFPTTNQATAIVKNNELVTGYPTGTKFVRFGTYNNPLTVIAVNNATLKPKVLATETLANSMSNLKLDRVLISDNSYVNTGIIEAYIVKGTNTFEIYVYKLFVNVDGVCGFEIKRSDTDETIKYQQYTNTSLTPRIYYLSISGLEIYLIIDWTNVTKKYSDFTGTSTDGVLNENAYILDKNFQISAYKYGLDISSINTQINNIITNEGNNLTGKKIAFVGDSITRGQAGMTPDHGGWAKLIGVKNSMTWSNFGVGGTCITKVTGRTDSIIERLEGYSSDFDFVLLQGGLNDTVQAINAIGTITTGYNATLDLFTFCGASEYMCKLALSKYSEKKVAFLINYNFGSTDISGKWKTLSDLLVQICIKWGMPYLDLRSQSGFNISNNDMATIYGVSTGSYPNYNATSTSYAVDDIVKYNSSTYKAIVAITAPAGTFDATKWQQVSAGTYDNWHCNPKAYNLLAPKIEAFLNAL